MKLNDAQDLIRKLEKEARSKSEATIYKRLEGVVSNLMDRKFTEAQLASIEAELDILAYPSDTKRKKHYSTAYNRFISFLRKEFELVTPNYYTNTLMVFGMTFGSGIGLAIGTALKAGTGTAIGMSLGTGVGMVMGISLGAAKDAAAKKEGRVLA